jgi:hypothetical protein
MTLIEILHFLVDGLSATAPVRDELHAAVDALEDDVKGKKTAAAKPEAPAKPVPPPLTAEQKAYYGITADEPVAGQHVDVVSAPAPAAGYNPTIDEGGQPLTRDDEIAELKARLAQLTDGVSPVA